MRRITWACVLLACRSKEPAPPLAIEPEAAPLLDAWAAAIGGRDRVAALHDVHVTGTWRNSGDAHGTFESWTTDRGEYRYESTIAPGVRETTVFDGTRGWASDGSGLVIELDGPALEQIRTRALVRSLSILKPGQLTGTVAKVSDTAIRVTTLGDRFPVTIDFDPNTHQPARIAQVSDGTAEVVEVRDWREVDGVVFPFADHTKNTDHATVAIDHQHGSFAPLIDRDDDVHFDQPGPITVPFELGKGASIYVEASINGARPTTFILDSGAPTLIDPARVPAAGIQPIGGGTMDGMGGRSTVAFAPGTTIGFPGVTIGKYAPRTFSMDATYPKEPKTIAGLLGAELFQRVVVEIDYPAHKLRLHDARTYRHPEATNALPFALVERSPLVEASLEAPDGTRMRADLEIDTGCGCDVLIQAPFAAEQQLATRFPKRVSDNDAFMVRRGGVLHLGSLVIPEPTLVIALTSDKEILTANDYAGMLGGLRMAHYRVTIDYKRKQIWFD
jgi:aspartyl protease